MLYSPRRRSSCKISTDPYFNQLTVNHSCNFINPATKPHIQNIEPTWRQINRKLSKAHTRHH
ncbi:hypothetical protein HZS_382 [Henneguya salminicola]|nr:hypothetical protein HZS_382 [Henneguya salminicola]